jgi:hypothetical protein
LIHNVYKPGGEVIIQPTGYPGKMCHNATEPYEVGRAGAKDTKEVEPVVAQQAPAAQQQQVGG